MCFLKMAMNIVVLAAAVTQHTAPAGGDKLSLEKTCQIYTRAVINRDLERLKSTLTASDTLHFIGTTGKMSQTRQAYERFHRDWFKETCWMISFEISALYLKKEFGYVILIFTYQEPNSEKKTSTLVSYVTLVFRKERGCWKVIADICTPISREIG